MTSQRLRNLVARHGGLVTQADLARDWGVSTARIAELVEHPTFPRPVGLLGGRQDRRVWAHDEVTAWRQGRMAGR